MLKHNIKNRPNVSQYECECCRTYHDWFIEFEKELREMLIGFRGVYHESARPVQIVKEILGETEQP